MTTDPEALDAAIERGIWTDPEKTYKGLVSRGDDESLLRVALLADSIDDARTMLEAEYGVGTVFSLRNEAAANRIRGEGAPPDAD